MRGVVLLLLCLSGAAVIAQPRSARELVQAWEKSWNTYDLRAVHELFVTDSSVTYFSSEKPGLIHGFDSLYRHHVGFGFVEGGKSSANRLWLTEVRYLEAAVTATWHFQRPGSPPQRGPVTFILVRDGKGYRIGHAHFSNDPKPK
ncbi:MAG: hypothetical protein SH819_12370 [Cytophagales bacterium]|mgnify:CR=1 FL=1|nr:hypothetical protein [Cytophagales bacterium]